MEWKKYDKTLLEFRNAGLNKSGTVVSIKDKDTGHINTILIGDVTEKFIERGTWPKYSLKDIVVQYKVVYDGIIECVPKVNIINHTNQDVNVVIVDTDNSRGLEDAASVLAGPSTTQKPKYTQSHRMQCPECGELANVGDPTKHEKVKLPVTIYCIECGSRWWYGGIV